MDPLLPGYRAATVDDAVAMAELVNIAGEGLPLYLWNGLATAEQTGWDVGYERARRESGSFSYRNTILREEHDGSVSAGLIGYPLPDEPQPTDYTDLPAMFAPLQQLEDLAPGTWYVNVLATYPEYRNQGYGRTLLEIAARLAVQTGRRGLSVIVADANEGARRLYERSGFREHAQRPMVKGQWSSPASNWVLLLRDGAR